MELSELSMLIRKASLRVVIVWLAEGISVPPPSDLTTPILISLVRILSISLHWVAIMNSYCNMLQEYSRDFRRILGAAPSRQQVKNLRAAKLEVLHAKQHWEAGDCEHVRASMVVFRNGLLQMKILNERHVNTFQRLVPMIFVLPFLGHLSIQILRLLHVYAIVS